MAELPSLLFLKKKLKTALLKAETNIVTFQPPSAGPNPPVEPVVLISAPVSIERIQEEIAEKTALERTEALFDILVETINSECLSVISKERILQLLGEVKTQVDNITTELNDIKAILARNGLT